MWILRQESVARMNRVDIVRCSQCDNPINIEIRLNRLSLLSNFIRFIRLETVQRVAVLVRIDRHRANSQLVRAAKNANGNLAPVGSEESFDFLHRYWLVW